MSFVSFPHNKVHIFDLKKKKKKKIIRAPLWHDAIFKYFVPNFNSTAHYNRATKKNTSKF
eukprot:SAG11_NODE_25_length_23789_cov_23.813592_10_plen_60_part_00